MKITDISKRKVEITKDELTRFLYNSLASKCKMNIDGIQLGPDGKVIVFGTPADSPVQYDGNTPILATELLGIDKSEKQTKRQSVKGFGEFLDEEFNAVGVQIPMDKLLQSVKEKLPNMLATEANIRHHILNTYRTRGIIEIHVNVFQKRGT